MVIFEFFLFYSSRTVLHCKRKRSNITMFHINLFLAYILRATTSILKDYLLWNGFALSKDVQQNGEMFGFKDDSSVSENNGSVWCYQIFVMKSLMVWHFRRNKFDIIWHVCLNKAVVCSLLPTLIYTAFLWYM